jgi:hypothetical protein
MSYYTYKTVTVQGDAWKNKADNSDCMLGVEVEIEEENDEVFDDDDDDDDDENYNKGIPYLEELVPTNHNQSGNMQDLQSPTNYYDAGEGDSNQLFQGSEKIPIIGNDDGNYDEAEQHRFKKIQALNGVGWQYPGAVEGPHFDDGSL